VIKKIRSMLQNVLGGGFLFAGIAVIVWTFTNNAPLENVMPGIVLLGMAAFMLFPEGMMKLIIPKGGETTPISRARMTTMDANKETEVDELLTHFKNIGITADLIDKKSQDPTRHKTFLGFGQPDYKFKIENRKVDYLELSSQHRRDHDSIYDYTCVYVVQIEVGNSTGKLWANYEAIHSGFFPSYISGFEWVGNSRLVSALRKDTELKEMLFDTSITNISVSPQDNHVDIEVVYHSYEPVRWDQGTIMGEKVEDVALRISDFIVFERIASHVREILRPLR